MVCGFVYFKKSVVFGGCTYIVEEKEERYPRYSCGKRY
jgi:hypothetical protein